VRSRRSDDETLDEHLMPLRYFGDQVLRRHAADVPDITGDLVEFGRSMLVTMDHEVGIGLAAPQVGRSIRMLVHGLPEEAPAILINPVIVESRGESVYQEGCLSIPGLYIDVVRPSEIHLKAWDDQGVGGGRDGGVVDRPADGMLARVVQHEMDHLDGLLFVDRIGVDDRIAAEAELRKRVAGTLGTSDPFLTGKAIKALLRKHT
jgi:peptide deformylase